MIETQHNPIIPMDLSSVITLIQSNGGEFAPLQYTITQESPDVTAIHVNVQACDPDTISIDIEASGIKITGNAVLNVSNNTPMILTRPVSTIIPLAPGIQLNQIHSQLNGDTLVLTIPLG